MGSREDPIRKRFLSLFNVSGDSFLSNITSFFVSNDFPILDNDGSVEYRTRNVIKRISMEASNKPNDEFICLKFA